ncbi:class I SAM-dependent methyltransferase [Allorhodopirellula solitaria]|uniref:Biotin biosynthesis protein BioC n=1 Tax=Allorhodopirellula solitaria TaxID=2527987 RepID=A0A5C5YF15_9BACT|nr:class I SAM-dependent methyltransferase [Allorhodopirellula solitaria]TWT73393.1 biotin biosynthesis protein BioC [Allorhodopirellula solitaria]
MPPSYPNTPKSPATGPAKRTSAADQTAWRRPAGVSLGTWRYAHEGSIASRYNEFVAGTPLCRLDLDLLAEVFPVLSDRPRHQDAEDSLSEKTEPPRQQTAEKPAEKKNDRSPKWVLDLGCGTGRASELLAASGYHVFAIDLSLPMLRQVEARGLPAVIPIQANLVELDVFAENIADGAVCLFSTLGMIQGRDNRRRFLAHVRRIVRPTGSFYLHVHHRYGAIASLPGWKQLAGSAISSLTRRDREFGDAVYAYRGLPDMFLHQFSRRELLADFEATGWHVARWERLSLDGAQMLGPGARKIAGGFLVVLQ